MNAKLLFKTVFLIAVLLLLVLLGVNNKSTVSFSLPPVLPKALVLPSALMYYAFFAVGLVTGTLFTAGGGGGKKSSSSGSKSSKSDK